LSQTTKTIKERVIREEEEVRVALAISERQVR
jgi:hypothetical protein